MITLQQELATLRQKYKTLETELNQHRQEAHQFEQRMQQSRLQIEQSTKVDIALQIISIIDVLELARNSIKPQTDRETAIQKGYFMLENRLISSLKEIGVHVINTNDTKFDSHFHEVLTEEGTNDYPVNTILGEFRRGYCLGARVLRLAQVKVAIALRG
jgi:molecular chaperone GrpE (heat shock protein)